jgi:very-short-patch-repair endonuclease
VTRLEPSPQVTPLALEDALSDSAHAQAWAEDGTPAAGSEIEAAFLRELAARGLMGPLATHTLVETNGARPDFRFPGQTVVYVDGEDGQRQARDQELVSQLENKGYMVLRFQERAGWDALLEDYAESFRRHA